MLCVPLHLVNTCDAKLSSHNDVCKAINDNESNCNVFAPVQVTYKRYSFDLVLRHFSLVEIHQRHIGYLEIRCPVAFGLLSSSSSYRNSRILLKAVLQLLTLVA